MLNVVKFRKKVFGFDIVVIEDFVEWILVDWNRS